MQKRKQNSVSTMGRKMTEAAYRWQILSRSFEQYDVVDAVSVYTRFTEPERSSSDCGHRVEGTPESSDEGCSALILMTYFFRIDKLLPSELVCVSSKLSYKESSSS
jgi:hypothetical protein